MMVSSYRRLRKSCLSRSLVTINFLFAFSHIGIDDENMDPRIIYTRIQIVLSPFRYMNSGNLINVITNNHINIPNPKRIVIHGKYMLPIIL